MVIKDSRWYTFKFFSARYQYLFELLGVQTYSSVLKYYCLKYYSDIRCFFLNMGRKSSLHEFEKGQIDAFKKNKIGNRLIAKNISRSEKVVRNYLRNPQSNGSCKSTGWPAALTDREKRSDFRNASNFIGTARQIALKVGCKIQRFVMCGMC